VQLGMFVKGQKLTSSYLFDHLIGTEEQGPPADPSSAIRDELAPRTPGVKDRVSC
jgi:hypothetical protein